jgi:hypothetical protein
MGFPVSNDILGIYNQPTAYQLADGRIAIFNYLLPDSDKRFKSPCFLKHDGRRIVIYEYDGTQDDLMMEAQKNNLHLV